MRNLMVLSRRNYCFRSRSRETTWHWNDINIRCRALTPHSRLTDFFADDLRKDSKKEKHLRWGEFLVIFSILYNTWIFPLSGVSVKKINNFWKIPISILIMSKSTNLIKKIIHELEKEKDWTSMCSNNYWHTNSSNNNNKNRFKYEEKTCKIAKKKKENQIKVLKSCDLLKQLENTI